MTQRSPLPDRRALADLISRRAPDAIVEDPDWRTRLRSYLLVERPWWPIYVCIPPRHGGMIVAARDEEHAHAILRCVDSAVVASVETLWLEDIVAAALADGVIILPTVESVFDGVRWGTRRSPKEEAARRRAGGI